MARNNTLKTEPEGTVTEDTIEGGAIDLSKHQNADNDGDNGEGGDDEDKTPVQDSEETTDGEGNEPEGGDDADSNEDDSSDEDESKDGAQFGLSGQAFQFSVNGQPTTDFAAVQAHITQLEGIIEHGRETSIEEFVKGLAEDGKILATQIDSLTGFAKSLDESQYTAWAGQYGDMPSLPLFGHHGAGSNRIENPEDLKESETIKKELGIQQEIKASFTSVNRPVPEGVEKKITDLEGQLAALEDKH